MSVRSATLRAMMLAALATSLLAQPGFAARAVDSTAVHPLAFRIEPVNPCPGDTVFLTADLCAPCGQFISGSLSSTGGVRFEISTRAGANCPLQPCPIASRSVRLGRSIGGSHHIAITTVVRTIHPDSTVHTTQLLSSAHWDVTDLCPPPPPPPPAIPYGLHWGIEAPAACDTCPAQLCPGEPLRVRLSGQFPDACYRIVALRTLPLGAPIDAPYVYMEVEHRDGPCTFAPVAFDTSITLSAQPPGNHVLRLELVESSPDSTGTDSREHIWQLARRFTVLDFCGPDPAACVWPWLSAPFDENTACAAKITPGGVATLPFAVNTPVALAGLQGDIQLEYPLRIESLDVGVGAAGMRLEWTRTGTGARWVLFSDRARIAANSPLPVLRVGLSLAVADPLPPRMAVLATVSGASDSLGGKVPVCNVRTFARYAGSIVCVERGCDVNGDGIANVRDLVRMAICLRNPSVCADSMALPDCNSDGSLNLDDVICCARQVLHGGPRDTSAVRPAPDLGVAFGSPGASQDGVELPFSLHGLGDLGSARVLLRYPSDQYEWNGASFLGEASGWITLAEEITPGVIALGAIRLGGDGNTLPWTLALKLRSGASGAGAVAVESGEFSAMDGVTLTSPVAGATSPRLGGPEGAPRLALGAARPNPTTGEARFAVELAFDSGVELTVHDLSGRHVATLFDGPMPAGTRDFLWRGSDETGRRSPDGVYFVRLKVDGLVRSQRVTVLRSR